MEKSALPIFEYLAQKGAALDFQSEQSWTADLYQGGIIDSIGILELVQFLEQRYDVLFSAEDLDPGHFKTIRDMVKLLNQRGSEIQLHQGGGESRG